MTCLILNLKNQMNLTLKLFSENYASVRKLLTSFNNYRKGCIRQSAEILLKLTLVHRYSFLLFSHKYYIFYENFIFEYSYSVKMILQRNNKVPLVSRVKTWVPDLLWKIEFQIWGGGKKNLEIRTNGNDETWAMEEALDSLFAFHLLDWKILQRLEGCNM